MQSFASGGDEGGEGSLQEKPTENKTSTSGLIVVKDAVRGVN